MLTNNDFKLSEKELENLNSEIARFGKVFAEEGEICTGMVIEFAFVPGFGRMVFLRYDGSQPVEINE